MMVFTSCWPVSSETSVGAVMMAHHNRWSRQRLSTFAAIFLLMLFAGTVMTASACTGSANTSGSNNASQTVPARWRHLEDQEIGFSLFYPPDWSANGHTIATQFAVGARCRSVRIIDFEPPADSGQAAPILQSLVQVCLKRQEQIDPLDHYMRRVYGESLMQMFEVMELNGTRAYRAKGQEHSKTIFAQNRNGYIQIVVAVAASAEKLSERLAQAEMILGSLMLN